MRFIHKLLIPIASVITAAPLMVLSNCRNNPQPEPIPPAPTSSFLWDTDAVTKTATIVAFIGEETEIDIPLIYTKGGVDYTLTSIGYYAFYGCTQLKKVIIPDTVKTISEYAFAECTELTSVKIGNSVECIGARSFSQCYNLSSIIIPDSVETIGTDAFAVCTSLSNVKIGNSVTEIGQSVFLLCPIKSIIIPDSVVYIGSMAFMYCTSLINVTLGNSIKIINDAAFFGCDNIKYNTYKNGKYLGNEDNNYLALMGVAENRYTITSFEINPSCKILGANCFASCLSLNSIVIPDSVVTIGSDAFIQCESLSTVQIGNSVEYIMNGVFVQCHNLAAVTMPASLKAIGTTVFQSCRSLTNTSGPGGSHGLKFTGTIDEWKQVYRSDGWHTPSETLTEIECSNGPCDLDAQPD